MIVEFIVIAVVFIGTIVFEVWLLISTTRSETKLIDRLGELQNHIDDGFEQLSKKINGENVNDTTNDEQNEIGKTTKIE